MKTLIHFIKQYKLYLIGLFGALMVLYYRFGSSLFEGLLITLVVISGLAVLGSVKIQEVIGMVIGGVILLGVIGSVLYFLFGGTLPFVILGAIVLFMYPKVKSKYDSARIETEVAKIESSGYFKNLFDERIKAMNADPESLKSDVVVSERTPKVRWLPLEEQLAFLEENIERMSKLSLCSYDVGVVPILNGFYDDIKGVMHNKAMLPFRKPLENLYARYGFNFEDTYDKLHKAIYSYNEFFIDASNKYRNLLEGHRSGILGEKRVEKELSLYKDRLLNLTNIRFKVDGESVESDSILITENGLFSLEIKNFGDNTNDKIKITKDGQWTREYGNGYSVVMKDVAAQANRHIGIKQRLINEKLKERLGKDTPYIPMQSIIVIANDCVRIENESDLVVVRASNIYTSILKNKDGGSLDRKYWEIIKSIILENNLPPNSFPLEENFDCLEKEFKSLWEQIKAFYVFSSMARTYSTNLIDAGYNKNMPIQDFDSELRYKTEAELKENL